MSDVKLFSYEEVAKHNTRKDLWMIISGKVYDITAFVDEHPGGEEVLIDEGAKDATGPFDDVGHSEDARELLEKYYVGDVDPASAPVATQSSTNTVSGSSAPQGNALRIIIPVLLILVWAYFRFFA
ncbi:cytochrome b5-like heme/steroid binding domain-containing protein [Phascolomyces articulosus]|uniref:Cytochrome b5-like heme/steroid binding domain-containing protein n=1 Tax=Phascolomyces articulosus TaxID=60185 RepID=A0AAD5PHJ6_9FUNG|nr:cytochrome b5-like heme/steroid binding domain-containing protein [Phascolomyces articulosus]